MDEEYNLISQDLDNSREIQKQVNMCISSFTLLKRYSYSTLTQLIREQFILYTFTGILNVGVVDKKITQTL